MILSIYASIVEPSLPAAHERKRRAGTSLSSAGPRAPSECRGILEVPTAPIVKWSDPIESMDRGRARRPISAAFDRACALRKRPKRVRIPGVNLPISACARRNCGPVHASSGIERDQPRAGDAVDDLLAGICVVWATLLEGAVARALHLRDECHPQPRPRWRSGLDAENRPERSCCWTRSAGRHARGRAGA